MESSKAVMIMTLVMGLGAVTGVPFSVPAQAGEDVIPITLVAENESPDDVALRIQLAAQAAERARENAERGTARANTATTSRRGPGTRTAAAAAAARAAGGSEQVREQAAIARRDTARSRARADAAQ